MNVNSFQDFGLDAVNDNMPLFHQPYFALLPVHTDDIAILELGCSDLRAQHRRDAVFTSNDGRVRERTARIGNNGASQGEERRPNRIGVGANKYISGLEFLEL